MSVTDPIIPVYDAKHDWWRLQQGRETFYDPDTRRLIAFLTKQDAIDWAIEQGMKVIDAIPPSGDSATRIGGNLETERNT